MFSNPTIDREVSFQISDARSFTSPLRVLKVFIQFGRDCFVQGSTRFSCSCENHSLVLTVIEYFSQQGGQTSRWDSEDLSCDVLSTALQL